MKIFLTAILCMLLCVPAFADQQTTVLAENISVNKAVGTVPYIDGSNDITLEKQANNMLRDYAKALAKEVGGSIGYEVTLNRPSVVSVLLKAVNGEKTVYKGVNIDLTSGREFFVNDFFVDDDAVKAALGEYRDVLFSEYGIYTRQNKIGSYDNFVPYSAILSSMRIGEAGRLVQIARLTQNAADKTLTLKKDSLMALKLDSNPSTGYRWELKLDTAAEGKIKKVGSSFTMPRGDDQRTGMPGIEIIVLAAQETGVYKVTMEYKRPWERMSVNSFTYTVIVEE